CDDHESAQQYTAAIPLLRTERRQRQAITHGITTGNAMLRGATSTVVCRSATLRADVRDTPGDLKVVPRALNSADSASRRIVNDTRRIRSRSASNRNGGCPH